MRSVKIIFPFLASFITVSLANSAAAPLEKKADVTNYAVYPGWDMIGNDLTVFPNGSEADCVKRCSTVSTCAGYTYGPYGFNANTVASYCILKSAVSPCTFQPATRSGRPVSTGLRGSCADFEGKFV